MAAKSLRKKAKAPAALRASVSFPPDLYHTLDEIARQKKVSVAWVVREAAEQYITAQWPLLQPDKRLAENGEST